jgi:hypothetical protein
MDTNEHESKNDEIRMTNDESMTKPESGKAESDASGFAGYVGSMS